MPSPPSAAAAAVVAVPASASVMAGLLKFLQDIKFLSSQRSFWVGVVAVLLYKLRQATRPRLPPKAQKPQHTPASTRGPQRLDGWGYQDTGFEVRDDGNVWLTGSRYLFSGQVFPNFVAWAKKHTHIDINDRSPDNVKVDYPPPLENETFLSVTTQKKIQISMEQDVRVFHCHGHTVQEVYKARYGRFHRIPDAVVFPRNEEEVLQLVTIAKSRAAAETGGVCLIPYGGGTSVSGALGCPSSEDGRMMVVVSMKHMNQVLKVDKDCMTAHVQAGMLGTDMDSALAAFDVCVGHEPDSCEFSSVGGWVATKASGMKKNMYGNIEDIVLSCRLVTPKGVLTRDCSHGHGHAPRESMGMLDPTSLALGSEGNLGIITSVTLRLRPLPLARDYGAIVFRSYEDGIKFMRQVALQRLAPASIRLIDHAQFAFSQALQPASEHASLFTRLKKWYVLSWLGFQQSQIAAATIVAEGEPQDVARQLSRMYELAGEYGGLRANRNDGIRGYFLTYCIAYLRDFGLKYWFMAESFETSVPWSQVEPMIRAVHSSIGKTCAAHKLPTPFISSRITQTYDTGACVYFYFGFRHKGVKRPLDVFGEVEDNARSAILEFGGSVSHHHGVGKIRKRFMKEAVGEHSIAAMRAIKTCFDPENVFGVANTVHDMEFEGVHAPSPE